MVYRYMRATVVAMKLPAHCVIKNLPLFQASLDAGREVDSCTPYGTRNRRTTTRLRVLPLANPGLMPPGS